MITSVEVEALKLQLQRSSGGAHIHSANKASRYLERIADKPKARFSTCTADEFVKAAKDAAYQNKWKELEKVMGAWW